MRAARMSSLLKHTTPLCAKKTASAAAPPQLVLVATSWFLALTCLWPHRLNHFNVGCSIFEQGRYGLILQHHATAGKLRRERAHTFFTDGIRMLSILHYLTQTRAQRQLLSPT